MTSMDTKLIEYKEYKTVIEKTLCLWSKGCVDTVVRPLPPVSVCLLVGDVGQDLGVARLLEHFSLQACACACGRAGHGCLGGRPYSNVPSKLLQSRDSIDWAMDTGHWHTAIPLPDCIKQFLDPQSESSISTHFCAACSTTNYYAGQAIAQGLPSGMRQQSRSRVWHSSLCGKL